MEPSISLGLPFLEMIIYTGVPAGIAWVRSERRNWLEELIAWVQNLRGYTL